MIMTAPAAPPGRLLLLPYLVLVVGIPAATVVAGFVTWQIAASGGDTIAPEPAVKRGLVIEDPRSRPAAPPAVEAGEAAARRASESLAPAGGAAGR